MRRVTDRRAAGLALGVVMLLLLAACSGAIPTGQVAENLATGAPYEGATSETEGVAPRDTAAPTGTTAPTDPAAPTATAVPTAAAVPSAATTDSGREYRIVTLLPPDAIPAIDDPQFYGVSEADEEYHPLEPVLGVEFDGEARAYSISLLSGHEIVNDRLAGRPISVTW